MLRRRDKSRKPVLTPGKSAEASLALPRYAERTQRCIRSQKTRPYAPASHTGLLRPSRLCRFHIILDNSTVNLKNPFKYFYSAFFFIIIIHNIISLFQSLISPTLILVKIWFKQIRRCCSCLIIKNQLFIQAISIAILSSSLSIPYPIVNIQRIPIICPSTHISIKLLYFSIVTSVPLIFEITIGSSSITLSL